MKQPSVLLAVAVCVNLLLPTGLLADSQADTHVDGTDGGQPPLPTLQVVIVDTELTVEIAATAEQRYMGLSFRRFLNESMGMLFVYPDERELTFTMRNTLLPLSIAFIGDDGLIVDIQDMNVGPNQLFPSSAPARYALEVNQGWFERHSVELGDRMIMQ